MPQRILLATLAAALVCAPSSAQPPADQKPPVTSPSRVQPAGPGPRTHIPGLSEPGPWDQDVLVYRAGPDGKAEKLATFERSGVPTLARLKDGRLIAACQHFPKDDLAAFDKVAVRFSSDEGQTWTAPSVITMDGLPQGMAFPFDPTLVPLPDGRVRMYFTSRRHGPGHETDLPAIRSGVSDDGVHYTMEPGVRFGVAGKIVIDCAVVLLEGKFHLFSPDNGSRMPQPGDGQGRRRDPGQSDGPKIGRAYHAVSEDGLAFTRVDDVQIDGRRRWLGNALSVPGEKSAKIVFVGTGAGPEPRPQGDRPDAPGGAPAKPKPGSGGGIWMAESADGNSWTLIDTPRIPGADPGAAKLTDGSWLLITTGEPREGTASARQRQRRPVPQ